MWCGVNGESVARDRERVRIAMMERNARFYVERATLAGRSATAILQGDPPPGRSATAIMQGDPPPGRSRHCYHAGRLTAWGAAATAIMQGDPLPGRSRIGCNGAENPRG